MRMNDPGADDDNGLQDNDNVAPAAMTFGDRMARRFKRELFNRALYRMRQRESKIMTETDIQAAYADLTVPSRASTMRRVIGDLAMIVGGCLVPLVLATGGVRPVDWAATIAGVVLIAVGIYVREGIREL